MPARLMYEDVKNKVESQGWILLEEDYFGNRSTKLKCMCPKGHIQYRSISAFDQKRNCKFCFMDSRKTNFDFIKETLESRGWILLETEYINSHTKMKCICPNGHIQEKTWGYFVANTGCIICSKWKYSKESVVEYLGKDGYFLLSDNYIDTKTEIEIMCPRQHIYCVRFSSFIRGQRCKICFHADNPFGQIKSKYNRKRIENGENLSLYPLLIKEWDYLTNIGKPEDYLPSSRPRINWICSICGWKWNTTINSRTGKKNSGCPKCNMSKGERKIEMVLSENTIKYFPQHRFDNCKYERELIFDFYLSDFNICIEYQGEQHYQVFRNNFFGGEESLARNKERDEIKQKYCEENNIPLLIIPYWDFDKIEEILTRELNL